MAKQKSFFDKVLQRIKRKSRDEWTSDFGDWMASLPDGMRAGGTEKPTDLVGDNFIWYLQLEALLRAVSIRHQVEDEAPDDEPLLYPGLVCAWQQEPREVVISPTLLEKVFEKGPQSIPLSRLRAFFPACLLIDIRPFKLRMYGEAYDALFCWPTYDEDRDYEALLIVAIGPHGLAAPPETKLVLRGETLADAYAESIAERRVLTARCFGGIDGDGMHEEYFAPFEDEQDLLEFTFDVFSFLCADGAVVNSSIRSGRTHWEFVLAEDEVECADWKTPCSAEVSKDAWPMQNTEHESDDDSLLGVGLELASGEEPADQPHKDTSAESDNVAERSAGEQDSEDLRAELEALREAFITAEQKASSLEYHLSQAQATADSLRAQVEILRSRADFMEQMDIPATPADALALAQQAFPDRLLVLDAARKSAAEFTRGDTKEVWAVLRSVASVLYPMVFGEGAGNIPRAFEAQTGFELAFRETKMTKASDPSGKRTVLYKGRRKDASAHVKGRGRKRGESLRVHFFADYTKRVLVITHCGEHLDTFMTSRL